jgi:hypothetical protein
MEAGMRFAKWVFTGAGIWGLISVAPLYFLEGVIAKASGAMTHPEYFYGFIGVTLAFQVLFLIVGRDPARLRPVMPACILEKATFGPAAWLLYLAGRTPGAVVVFASIDMALGVLFLLAWLRTRPAPAADTI